LQNASSDLALLRNGTKKQKTEIELPGPHCRNISDLKETKNAFIKEIDMQYEKSNKESSSTMKRYSSPKEGKVGAENSE